MLNVFTECPRGLDDCLSRGMMRGDGTFVCAGVNDGTTPIHEQDIYRMCWETEELDLLMDIDGADAIQMISVLSTLLATSNQEG